MFAIRVVLLLAIIMGIFSCPKKIVSVVTIKKTDVKGWELLVNGSPFFIMGAGGYKYAEELKMSGGNAIRTWESDEYPWARTGSRLKEAHELGLMVMLGLELKPRSKMDYSNTELVNRQLEAMRLLVRRHKAHPALLAWGIGNEVEQQFKDDQVIWSAIEEIAKMVHEEDPNHPTVAVLAGQKEWKINKLIQFCPSIDVIGFNSYSELPSLHKTINKLMMSKPWLVTEYGPDGWWQMEKTKWGVLIEPSSHAKALMYKERYLEGIQGKSGCLGSFAFILGHKEEATLTLFGTHTQDGHRLEALDVLEEVWTGKPPEHRAPVILSITSTAQAVQVSPRTQHTVQAEILVNRPVRYIWQLATDTSSRTKSGDPSDNESIQIIKRWETKAAKTSFVTPDGTGDYRLYFYLIDDMHKAATANFPFQVKTPRPPTPEGL